MKNRILDYVGPLKLLLILGVVLLHCNIAVGTWPYENYGLAFVDFVSGKLALVCVPIFFVLSGYLYFYNISNLTFSIYFNKLTRRVSTLLVPYLFWNAFCALLLIGKVEFLGFNGLGIIDADGVINIGRFVKGFWMIHQSDDMPFAFAFWFIRNLMCFVVISPLFYWIGRRWMLTALVIAGSIILDESFWGSEYFVVGACLALHGYDLKYLHLSGWRLGLSLIAYMASALAIFFELNTTLYISYISLRYILVFSGFVTFVNIALRMKSFDSTRLGSVLVGSTFFIYAFHQCFCRIVRDFWLAVIGDGEWYMALMSYLMSFLTMVALSVGMWVLMRRFAPKVLAVITGSR